jgi:hypothetical protein
MPIAERVGKAARDFRRIRDRRGYRHSPEYTAHMESEAWVTRRKRHKEQCEYRCQLCGKETTSLECHHTPRGYDYLREELDVHLLALCDECHLIADMLRETKGETRYVCDERTDNQDAEDAEAFDSAEGWMEAVGAVCQRCGKQEMHPVVGGIECSSCGRRATL